MKDRSDLNGVDRDLTITATYNNEIDSIREHEFPMLKGSITILLDAQTPAY